MAAGFPLSRQAPQPEQTPRPPHPSNTQRHQAPHGLQPQPQAAATFSPASARSQCRQSRPEAIHRPLILPRLPERPRPDPLTAARLSHRLAAQTYRFLQRHPQVEHLEVVVITPHQRHKLGPAQLPRHLRVFLAEVHWISLEALSQQPDLDPLLNLLTLPVRPESELPASSQQILASRPDLDTVVLSILAQRFPYFSAERIMVIAGIPIEEIRHTRAVQDWLAEGRQEGEAKGRQEGRREGLQEGKAQEAAKVTLRLLNRRCGPLSETTTHASRHFRWSSWMPCSTSRAQPTWQPGWPPIPEAPGAQSERPNGQCSQVFLGLQFRNKGASEHDDACQRQFT
ncbi:DUF2887 domain-containing protein [Cyanobium sp. BA20m-p-22]|nr:DUF2887 domain-containing protein [Cyanobium sp. BA20m-p-22]MCP9910851.1 DUF2887 domain-containing protein [Cyanobium sp. BA20m-p-22]